MAECHGRSVEACYGNSTCPDLVFSEGSQRTVENVVACARAWATTSCEELAIGSGPDCAVPGTKQAGEECLHHSQCSTLSCPIAGGDDCGSCQAPAAPKGPCVLSSDCPGAQTCNDATGLCRPPVVLDPDLGEDCQELCRDFYGMYCSSAGKCELRPPAGQPCAEGIHCLWNADLYCRSSDLTCQLAPAAGMPCGETPDGALMCDREAYCDGALCQALPVAGEPCLDFHACAPGLDCDNATDDETGVCRVIPKKGEPCPTGLECETGLTCDAGVCKLAVGPELPCADGSTICFDSHACEGGVCVPRELQGTFAELCP